MIVTRTSTFNTHQQTLGDAGQTQALLNELQQQISSGLKTKSFKGLYGEVEAFTSLDDKMKRTDEFLKNNAILSSRVNLMGASLNNVTDAAREISNSLLLRRNGTANDSVGFESQLDSAWQTIASQLNISVEGRNLFGGIRTDRLPVDASSFPTLYNDEGLPESNYYRGATQDVLMRVQDGFDVPINVRADDPAIQKIYSAFALALEGHQANDEAILSRASEMMSEGIEGVNLMQVNIGTIQISLDRTAEQQGQQSLYWKGVKEEMISTDLVSASTQVAINQGILQASFQTFARISSLKLSDFL